MAEKSILTNAQGKTLYPVTDISCVNNAPNVKCEEYVGNVEQVIGVTREELKKDLFIDMWNKACIFNNRKYGQFNEETQLFECNGITDIDTTEALAMLLYYPHCIAGGGLSEASVFKNVNNNKGSVNLRTMFPIILTNHGGAINWDSAFTISTWEVLQFCKNAFAFYPTTQSSIFSGSNNLRKILGWGMNSNTTFNKNSFNCTSLEVLEFTNLCTDIDFHNCPLLNVYSFNYILENATNTSPITITVHPDVYAKLIGGDEEWQALNTLALEKQITFATT